MDDTFWEVVCGMVPWCHTLAIVDVVVLFLLLFSFLHLDPDQGAFIAASITLVVVVLSLVLYAVVVRGCVRHNEISLGR
jgi:hypothetical protein